MFLRLASRGLRKPSTVIGLRQFIVAKPTQLRTPTILSFGAVRFNSTDAAKEAVNSESVSQAVKDALNSTSSKFDTTLGFDPDTVVANGTSSVTDAVSHVTDLTSDQLGYLHSVGLVDGWYPSDIMQEALELVHVFSGMPWWLTITLTTIGIRLLLFPLFMKSSNTMAKSQLVMPQTKRLRNEINTAVSRGDQRMQQIKMFQLKQLNKKYGIKYRDMFISPVIQMTFAMGAFFGVREMANLPVEGFSNGGSMWFTDLTASDPYIGLQLISACLYAASFKWGGETAVAQYGPKMKKIFMALPFVSVLFTWNLSAGVMVYLTANGLCSIVQSRLLRSDEFRKWAKMAPLNMQKAEAAAADEEKSKGMMGNLTQQWDDMKTNASIRTDMEEKANKAIALQKKKARSSRVIIKKRRDRAN